MEKSVAYKKAFRSKFCKIGQKLGYSNLEEGKRKTHFLEKIDSHLKYLP